MTTKTTAVAVQESDQNKVTQQLLMDYLKQTNSTLLPNEQAQFLAIAQTFNLNPWKREVYAVAYGQGNNRKLSIIVGYEVYLRRAEEFPQYDGYETKFSGEGINMCCTCIVHRKDRCHPIGSTVFLREYSQNNSMWNTKPHVMLEKVAIATAMRRAFPSQFNGMPYTSDELPDNMTGADKLNQQGYTEVPVPGNNVEAEAPAENEEAAPQDPPPTEPPKDGPLSEKRKVDFLKMIAEETKRVGKDAMDELVNRYGGYNKLYASKLTCGKFCEELKQLEEVPF